MLVAGYLYLLVPEVYDLNAVLQAQRSSIAVPGKVVDVWEVDSRPPRLSLAVSRSRYVYEYEYAYDNQVFRSVRRDPSEVHVILPGAGWRSLSFGGLDVSSIRQVVGRPITVYLDKANPQSSALDISTPHNKIRLIGLLALLGLSFLLALATSVVRIKPLSGKKTKLRAL